MIKKSYVHSQAMFTHFSSITKYVINYVIHDKPTASLEITPQPYLCVFMRIGPVPTKTKKDAKQFLFLH